MSDFSTEQFAQEHADQWLGCVVCKESHHDTGFCSCGRCLFQYIGTPRVDNSELGTFVSCECGKVVWWD